MLGNAFFTPAVWASEAALTVLQLWGKVQACVCGLCGIQEGLQEEPGGLYTPRVPGSHHHGSKSCPCALSWMHSRAVGVPRSSASPSPGPSLPSPMQQLELSFALRGRGETGTLLQLVAERPCFAAALDPPW